MCVYFDISFLPFFPSSFFSRVITFISSTSSSNYQTSLYLLLTLRFFLLPFPPRMSGYSKVMEDNKDVRHIMVGSIHSPESLAVLCSFILPNDKIHVLHLNLSSSSPLLDDDDKATLEAQVKLYSLLERCTLPVIVGVYSDQENADVVVSSCHARIAMMADISVASVSSSMAVFSGEISSLDFTIAGNRLPRSLCRRFAVDREKLSAQDSVKLGLVDMILPNKEVARAVKRISHRMNQAGGKLMKSCKTQLPAPTVEEALLCMARLAPPIAIPLPEGFSFIQSNSSSSGANNRSSGRPPLVRVSIESDGVAIVELNDPVHYNGESPELISDLHNAVLEIHQACLNGSPIKSVVLQGVGPHFCTGANMGELEEKMTTW
jgi:enoyl-CoA hydratase/carnithine racemase